MLLPITATTIKRLLKYKDSIAEIDNEFSEKVGRLSETTGVTMHEAYKDLLTSKFIDNSLMTSKFLFRATRANNYRKVYHKMKFMEVINFQSLLHYYETFIFRLLPIDDNSPGGEFPNDADPRGVTRALNESNAQTELKEWFNESINRSRDQCIAAVKITPLIGKPLEEVVELSINIDKIATKRNIVLAMNE